ncbi:MAG: hypothetical protein ACTHXC_00530 [Brachybacterium sp.]
MSATYINPALPETIRGLYKADLREKSIQNMLDLAANLVQELIDTREQADRDPSDAEPVAYALLDRNDGELVSIQRWPTGTEHVAFDVRPLYAAQEARIGG